MRRAIAIILLLTICFFPGCSTVNPEANDYAATEYYESQHEQWEEERDQEERDRLDELYDRKSEIECRMDEMIEEYPTEEACWASDEYQELSSELRWVEKELGLRDYGE